MRKDTAHVQRGTPFTGREEQVIALFAKGLSRGEICARLNVSPSLVSWALEKVRIRLGCNTKVEAAIKYATKERREVVKNPPQEWSGRIADLTWSSQYHHNSLFKSKR